MANYSINILPDADKPKEIELQGNLVIHNIEKIHNDFALFLQKKKNLKVSVNKIESIDLPGIQFIIALKLKCDTDNHEFILKPDKKIKETIKLAGFEWLLEK